MQKKGALKLKNQQMAAMLAVRPLTDEFHRGPLGHLHRHIADHPTRGLTPAKLASILLEAEQGSLISQCELAEDIGKKDGHIFAELQKRRRALSPTAWISNSAKPPKAPATPSC